MQRLIDIRYEELVVSPERVMKRLRFMLDLVDIVDVVNKKNNNYNNDDNDDDDDDDDNNNKEECKLDYKANTNDATTTKIMHVVLTASKFQVKLPIYLKSIGKWKRYSYHLKYNIIPEFIHYLPYLSSIKALPFIKPCMLRYLQFIYKQPYYHKRYVIYDHHHHHQDTHQQPYQDSHQQNYTYYRIYNQTLLSNIQHYYHKYCPDHDHNHTTQHGSYINWLLSDDYNYTQLISSLSHHY